MTASVGTVMPFSVTCPAVVAVYAVLQVSLLQVQHCSQSCFQLAAVHSDGRGSGISSLLALVLSGLTAHAKNNNGFFIIAGNQSRAKL